MLDFILALWDQWVALMSGVVGLLLGVGIRVVRRANRFKKLADVPDWLFLIVGLLCMFWASYRAWTVEHERVIELVKENRTLMSAADDRQVEIEVERRRRILYSLRQELMLGGTPLPSPAMMAGSEALPKEWTEKRLNEMGETWHQDRYLDVDKERVRRDLMRTSQ